MKVEGVRGFSPGAPAATTRCCRCPVGLKPSSWFLKGHWSIFTSLKLEKAESHCFTEREVRPGQRDPDLSVQRIGLPNAAKLNISCEGPDQTRGSEECARTWDDCVRVCWDSPMWHTQVALTGRKRMQLNKSALWGKYRSFHVAGKRYISR